MNANTVFVQQWTPFDANDSKTWPPKDDVYFITKRYSVPYLALEVKVALFMRDGSDYFAWETSGVIAWMRMPAPYQPLEPTKLCKHTS